jgi:hypothetical protein
MGNAQNAKARAGADAHDAAAVEYRQQYAQWRTGKGQASRQFSSTMSGVADVVPKADGSAAVSHNGQKQLQVFCVRGFKAIPVVTISNQIRMIGSTFRGRY